MPKYEHVIPKQTSGSFASDPPQDISNASSGILDKELSTSSAVVLGLGVMYGKKVATAGVQALIQQSGNKQYERAIEVGTTLLGYAALGIASGPAAIYTVPLAISADFATKLIDNAVENKNTQIENQRIIDTRGVRRKFGVGGFNG